MWNYIKDLKENKKKFILQWKFFQILKKEDGYFDDIKINSILDEMYFNI
jgi:hypothetical protein